MPDKCTDFPRDCPLLLRVEALEEDAESNKSAHKEFYEKLENSHTSVAVIEERLEQIKGDTAEIKGAVRSLEAKPGKRWDGLVDKLLFTAAGAALMWIASGMPGVGS